MPVLDEIQKELDTHAKSWADELADINEERNEDLPIDLDLIQRDMNEQFAQWVVAMFVEDEFGGDL